jgi:pimeloyl-ACP methyl ester carboxylesterase
MTARPWAHEGIPMPAATDVQPFPAGFRTEDIQTNGTTLYVRVGGQGSAVILLHGYGETGDMWAPLAADLARDHTIVAPDLRGMGLSVRPASVYDKKTQGQDVAGVLDALGIERADLVTHDIGNMVGYAFAAQYPDRVTRFALMDAPPRANTTPSCMRNLARCAPASASSPPSIRTRSTTSPSSPKAS